MSNSFNRNELARYYNDIEKCGFCGKHKADAFHHIFTRAGKYTSSIMNSMPLCNHSCHLPFHGDHMKRENQEKFIVMTAKRLHREGYKLTELDMDFLQENNLLELIKEIL